MKSKLLFLSIVLIMCNCVSSFLTNQPKEVDIGKAEKCSISAINLKYNVINKLNIKETARNVIVGYNTELIKQILRGNNIYCDSNSNGGILNVTINENSYYRFAGIKTNSQFWSFFSGLSLCIIPYSVHCDIEIIATIGVNGNKYRSSGREIVVYSTPLFFLAPFNHPTKKHIKMIKAIINDICNQMKGAF
jgi:hypothetical protein